MNDPTWPRPSGPAITALGDPTVNGWIRAPANDWSIDVPLDDEEGEPIGTVASPLHLVEVEEPEPRNTVRTRHRARHEANEAARARRAEYRAGRPARRRALLVRLRWWVIVAGLSLAGILLAVAAALWAGPMR